MHGVPEDRGSVFRCGLAIEPDDERQRAILMQFCGPADDELFGLGIEIALTKGSGIHRVQELIDLAEVHLDGLTVAGQLVAGGRSGNRSHEA